jgi:hypothetical protein
MAANRLRAERIYVGLLASEREAFERVAAAMGLDMSGMVRSLVLEKARALGLSKPAKKRAGRAVQ